MSRSPSDEREFSVHRFTKITAADPATIVILGVGRGDDLSVWKDLYPNARVVGVEPLPEHLKKLRDRWLWDPQDLVPCAVAAAPGRRTLHCNYEPDQRSTFYQLLRPLQNEVTREVDAVTLQEVRRRTKPWGCPVLLWVDAEGAEAEIFDGVRDANTLHNVRWINCEVAFHSARPEAALHDDVDRILQRLGYKLFAVHSLPRNGRSADAVYLTQEEWHERAHAVADMQQQRKLRRLDRRARLRQKRRLARG